MLKYILTMVFFCVVTVAHADEPSFQSGKDYVPLDVKLHENRCGAKSVRVMEFFSFGCPWCYKLEAPLQQWITQQGNNVTFIKVPVVFNPSWIYYAKAYFLIHSLKLGNNIQSALFKAIIEEKQSLNNTQAMVDFFTKNGVKSEVVESVFGNSPSIDIELKANAMLMTKYQITAIPAFVIPGRYKTDLQMAKTPERLIAILNFLISEAKKNTKDCVKL